MYRFKIDSFKPNLQFQKDLIWTCYIWIVCPLINFKESVKLNLWFSRLLVSQWLFSYTKLDSCCPFFLFSSLFFNRILMQSERDGRSLDDENYVLFKVLYNLCFFDRNGFFHWTIIIFLFLMSFWLFLGMKQKRCRNWNFEGEKVIVATQILCILLLYVTFLIYYENSYS